MSEPHAAAATAAALGGFPLSFQSGKTCPSLLHCFLLGPGSQELSYSVLEFGTYLVHEEMLEKFLRPLGKEKIMFVQKDAKGSSERMRMASSPGPCRFEG